jgi:hypothetical protein
MKVVKTALDVGVRQQLMSELNMVLQQLKWYAMTLHRKSAPLSFQ